MRSADGGRRAATRGERSERGCGGGGSPAAARRSPGRLRTAAARPPAREVPRRARGRSGRYPCDPRSPTSRPSPLASRVPRPDGSEDLCVGVDRAVPAEGRGPVRASRGRRSATAGSSSTVLAAVTAAATSPSATSRPASPTTSGMDVLSNATTGVPHPIASSSGRPNPSARLVKRSSAAPRYSATRSGTQPDTSTRSGCDDAVTSSSTRASIDVSCGPTMRKRCGNPRSASAPITANASRYPLCGPNAPT